MDKSQAHGGASLYQIKTPTKKAYFLVSAPASFALFKNYICLNSYNLLQISSYTNNYDSVEKKERSDCMFLSGRFSCMAQFLLHMVFFLYNFYKGEGGLCRSSHLEESLKTDISRNQTESLRNNIFQQSFSQWTL